MAPKLNRIILLVLCLWSFSQEKAWAEGAIIQRVIIGVPVLNYSRQTVEKSNKDLSPYGVAAEYTLFLTPSMAVSGQFVANSQTNQLTAQTKTVFQGGGVGITWFYKGGVDPDYEDIYIKSQVSSRLHLYAQLGVIGRSFDFSSIDQAVPVPSGSSSGVIVQDPEDITKGSFIAPLFGMGAEVPVLFNIYIGTKVQVFNSLASNTSPSIAGLEFWFYAGTQVNNILQ